jgi:hypothetical protein
MQTPPPAEPAPEPAVTDESVRTAVADVENSGCVPDAAALEDILNGWGGISSKDRTEILLELGYLMGRGQLNKHNFRDKATNVIAQVVAVRYFAEAKKHLGDHGAARIANSQGRNIRFAIERENFNRPLLENYLGYTLQNKVRQAAHHSEYRYDRHCNDWCW